MLAMPHPEGELRMGLNPWVRDRTLTRATHSLVVKTWTRGVTAVGAPSVWIAAHN